MAETKFTEDELKNKLFMELIKPAPDSLLRRFTIFHGFYTEETLIRSRSARELANRMSLRRDGSRLSMSEYLYFLAELFADIERQDYPHPDPAGVISCACGMRREADCKGPKDCDNHVDRLLPNVSAVEALRPFKNTTCPTTGRPCRRGCFDAKACPWNTK